MPRMNSTALRDENKVGIKHVNKNALSRLLKIIFSDHRGALIVVMVCILITVFTNVANSMFLSTLIDDYITPMLASGSRDFSGLDRAIATMIGIYAAGIDVYKRQGHSRLQSQSRKCRWAAGSPCPGHRSGSSMFRRPSGPSSVPH